jgi:hypothetical protein
MTWTYRQTTGELYRDGSFEGAGYSGHAEGVNNPALQGVHGVGPIPAGAWSIGPPGDHIGPLSFPLTPKSGTDARGRSGFYLHGDNSAMNESASEGCIVMGRAIRAAVADSGDRDLVVAA